MKILKKIFLAIINILTVSLVFLFLSASVSYAAEENNNIRVNQRLDNNRQISFEPIEAERPSPIKRGVFAITAYAYACAGFIPYEGSFGICSKSENCYDFSTNKWGRGYIWVPSDEYTIHPPKASGYNWSINPSSYRLYDRSYILVRAVGINPNLYCPVGK